MNELQTIVIELLDRLEQIEKGRKATAAWFMPTFAGEFKALKERAYFVETKMPDLPTPTVELQASHPYEFEMALRWKVGNEEFGTSHHVSTTEETGFPFLKREQLVVIEKVIQSYVEWCNKEMMNNEPTS